MAEAQLCKFVATIERNPRKGCEHGFNVRMCVRRIHDRAVFLADKLRYKNLSKERCVRKIAVTAKGLLFSPSPAALADGDSLLDASKRLPEHKMESDRSKLPCFGTGKDVHMDRPKFDAKQR